MLFRSRPSIAGVALTALCSAATASGQVDRTPPAWARNAVVYEVNVRQYTPAGTFAALRPLLPRVRAIGADILWLMPVQRIGVVNRKGALGSYYSISNYRAINPEFGTESDFRALADDAHRLGMKVILDWVPNHTSFDHVWIKQHPDWYLHRADGTIANAVDESGKPTDWTDVAQLNYNNPDMRRAMIADMRWWLDSMRVDGFRCDFVAGVPLDFWVDARQQLAKARPDIFLLAEAESPALGEAFDMSYGWELYHLLNDVTQGKKSTNELDAYFERQRRAYRSNDFHMYFTSNHDENSWNGTEFERMGANHQAAYVLSATVRGSTPLLYGGQEASLKKRLRFFEKDTIDWSGPSLVDFYRTVFALKHAEPALANGAWGGDQTTLHTNGGARVYSVVRTRDANSVLVAVNFGDAPVTAKYTGLARTGAYTDWFNKSSVSLSGAGTLTIPAHGYRVLVQGGPAKQ